MRMVRLVFAMIFFVWMTGRASPPSSAPEAMPLRLESGQSFARTAAGETGIRFHVTVPTSYDATAPAPPLLITFSPGGRGEEIARSFKEGADRAGWVLVGCDSLRNGMKDHELELQMEDEVLDAIFKCIPHNPQRIYLGGFSGGAMRSYGLTARRSEPFAGVLACGGWLGGPDYQEEPYREGLFVAMINGLRDKAANGWMPIDTKTLRRHTAVVKHFAYEGGHGGAPKELIASAIEWQEKQWVQRSAAVPPARIPLDLLYVGPAGARADEFVEFLSGHFRTVRAMEPNAVSLEESNWADVLLLDAPVGSLPEGGTTAALMIGSSVENLANRYGSKLEVLSPTATQRNVWGGDLPHPLFQKPLDACPVVKGQVWQAETAPSASGPIARWDRLQNAADSEILAGGQTQAGVPYVSLAREAHRLFWAISATPSGLTDSGRCVLVNALVWIHQYDGHAQTVRRKTRTRDQLMEFLNRPELTPAELAAWVPSELLVQLDGNAARLRDYFASRLPYVYVPAGSGLLRVDRAAERLKTPNNQVASLAVWIEMLKGKQGKQALELLHRYSGKRFRKKNKDWIDWFETEKANLHFRDDAGYRFEVIKPE